MIIFNPLPALSKLSNNFLIWTLALIIFLTTICCFITIQLQNISSNWQNNNNWELMIHIPPITDYKATQSSKIEQTKSILKKFDSIKKINIISDQELQNILKAWFKSDEMLEEIKLPIILELQTDKDNINIKALNKALTQAIPNIKIYNHNDWLTQLIVTINKIEMIVLSITTLMIITLIIATILATRFATVLCRKEIKIISIVGASNHYIASRFAYIVFKISLLGSSLGATVALLSLNIFNNLLSLIINYDLQDNIKANLDLENYLLLPIIMTITMSFISYFMSIKQINA